MKRLLLALILTLGISLTLVYQPVHGEECDIDCLERQIKELEERKKLSEAATNNLEGEVQSLLNQVESVSAQIKAAMVKLNQLSLDIQARETKLAQDYEIMASRVLRYYKRSRSNSGLMALLSSESAAQTTREVAYQAKLNEQDRQIIIQTTSELVQLENDKSQLEHDQVQLAALQSRLDSQAKFYQGEITKARAYQKDLKAEIAKLSARQQEIIDARSGSFTFTLGSGELADEYLSSAKGFRESAPGGYFAVFSFGGYSHRKGMSQYGARGRAESGQNYKDILKAYYGKEPADRDTGGGIRVAGQGEIDFEGRYLLGIAEMPSSWHIEALKAQAVAARTYAYRFKAEGREICTTEACQVFSASKADNPPDKWKEAVESTRGQILEDVTTFYSSTSGGFLSTKGWDTTDGNGGADFIDKSYERLGNSPWLEKAWWRQGYTNSGATCGRANPWLSPEEMADIVNVAIALRTGGIDTSRITPLTTNCWEGNPYSMNELYELVKNHGGITSANSVSVAQGNGVTNSVTINGVNISGADFRRAFNLRAPGHLRIPQYPNTYGNPFFYVAKK